MSRFRMTVVIVVCTLFSVLPLGASRSRGEQAQGQATIVGSVVNASLTPLAGVAVVLERAGRVEAKTTTDSAGKFRFEKVAAGDYRVRIEYTGFPPFARDVHVTATSTTVQLPIVLARAEDKLERADMQQRNQPTAAPAGAVPPPAAQTQTAQGQAGAAGGGGGRGGGAGPGRSSTIAGLPQSQMTIDGIYRSEYPPPNGETYGHIDANRFQTTLDRPLSTFGADVDTASYTNVRRMLSSGQLPPRDAVRVEEMINYFRFGYAEPRDGRPIAITTEIGDCPWEPTHKLVLIGARAKTPPTREITGRNIVLLIDVSGSMAPAERLPLIKTALGMFVDTLRPDDTLAIVTYAGTSGVALFPTPARHRESIQRAIQSLNAGGSTNGGQGLIMAYRVAREAFITGGVNRVILATDGDFNVGITSQYDLLNLIERERESGVFLSVFGVGSGNLKDATMEMLADRGNGHYAYLDSLQEARRLLVREGDATLETVAKDVKFQVEFNPAAVSAWKLIGYENRALAARDFNNDRKDAGEMGAGHTVTVLYEVIPAGVNYPDDRDGLSRPEIDPLRYQPAPSTPRQPPVASNPNGEWLTVKVRYKMPEGETSELITQPVRAGTRVQYLPLASAVAEFGLLLRDAPRNVARWDALARRVATLDAPSLQGADRESFKELVSIAASLSRLR